MKRLVDEKIAASEQLKLEKEQKDVEWQKQSLKLTSLESLEVKIDRELEALLIKRHNNNDRLNIRDLLKLKSLNFRNNETIAQIVDEMTAISIQRLARGFLA
jgi:hypothetical protein